MNDLKFYLKKAGTFMVKFCQEYYGKELPWPDERTGNIRIPSSAIAT